MEDNDSDNEKSQVNINIPKKRGRKPKAKDDKLVTKKKQQPTAEKDYGVIGLNPDDDFSSENLILHLKINSKNSSLYNSSITTLTYSPNFSMPTPYDENGGSYFPVNHNTCDSEKRDDEDDIKEEDKKSEKDYEMDEKYTDEPVKLMIEDSIYETYRRQVSTQNNNITKNTYPLLPIIDQMSIHHYKEDHRKEITSKSLSNLEKNDNVNILYKTDICCWWCCHNFNWEPFMLPVNYENGVFSVVGYFSSPECVAAYIFEQGAKYGDIHKQYSWLHLLYSKIVNGYISKIKLALPRETLKTFGGPYSINEYRGMCDNYYMDVKIVRHPFIPANGIVEETMSEYSNKKKFIPLDKERVQKASDELKLKRMKKKNSENTLDKFMNLKVLQQENIIETGTEIPTN